MTKENLKIFIISLQDSHERRKFMVEQLSKLDVNFEFFNAITPLLIPEYIANSFDDNFRKLFRSRPLCPGEKACYASHYSLWERCVKIGKPIVILEDDCFILDSFKNFIEHHQNFMENINYLNLEEHPTIKGVINSKQFVYSNVGGGARGYYLTPRAARAFLNKSRLINRAIDNFIADGYLHNIPSLGLKKHVIKNQDGEFRTTLGNHPKSKVLFRFKITRELYRFYRFTFNAIWKIKVRFLLSHI